jgi:hypothetical protein
MAFLLCEISKPIIAYSGKKERGFAVFLRQTGAPRENRELFSKQGV